MNQMYELDIQVTYSLSIHYIQNESIANVFVNTKEKNLLTKSADLMTFKGLLNIIAFFTQSDHYAINEDGVILYSDIMEISPDLYLQLEDSTEYYYEIEDDTINDFDNRYQVTLYVKNPNYENDNEIASYGLNQSLTHLFLEIEDYKTNDLYRNKIKTDDLFQRI
ncbi:hypothetical protein KHQ81_07935 [Mycoplasmatota bacterium]|nr:hypothetical protein KHQ81_07935 [Mycoplasmatota bacterium]